MLDEIRPEGKNVSSEKKKEYARAYAAKKRAEKRAQKLVTGQALPKDPKIAARI